METGQWFMSREGHRWWFDSGAISLDFAYTGSMADNPVWERLQAPSDLSDWLAGRFERMDAATTERELVDALALRSAIAGVTHALNAKREPDADDIDTINLFAATPNIPPALPGGNRHAGHSSVRVGQALATIARNAVALFADNAQDRLRECAADDCQLIFYDESRSNNRRWCSMQRCGNRSKVRAHRARSSR
ncbi:CGNR zinc finger domain-containing protein [Glaciihabitans sp. UYNi722]|uniref:CGNR zinc finger domain-containing protein n=1 Tax=Glaciihabitans sp. UYNi722 TaxID=3156344 RepID=UPI0033956035